MTASQLQGWRPTTAGTGAGADLIVLTGADLTVADVEAVARGGASVRLGSSARARMDDPRAVIERLVADGATVYGVTTGFGALADLAVPA